LPRDFARTLLLRAFLTLGGLALFAMIGVDFASVVARHLGLRFLGSIEIVQLCIVVAVGSALVAATLTGAHASVHLLVSRVNPAWRARLERLSEAATLLAFALLCAGGLWVLADLWPLDERSDLLRLPFAPARVFWGLVLALAATVSLAGLFAAPGAEAPVETASDV
jgi:TRAP-type C4-dicarboxylate transport system permease small subunit